MNKEEGKLCLAPQPCELRSNCTAVSIYIVTTPAAELKGEIPSFKECCRARIILSSYCSVMKLYVAFGTGRLNILLCQELAIEVVNCSMSPFNRNNLTISLMTYRTTEFINRMGLKKITWMGGQRLRLINSKRIVDPHMACHTPVRRI